MENSDYPDVIFKLGGTARIEWKKGQFGSIYKFYNHKNVCKINLFDNTMAEFMNGLSTLQREVVDVNRWLLAQGNESILSINAGGPALFYNEEAQHISTIDIKSTPPYEIKLTLSVYQNKPYIKLILFVNGTPCTGQIIVTDVNVDELYRFVHCL